MQNVTFNCPETENSLYGTRNVCHNGPETGNITVRRSLGGHGGDSPAETRVSLSGLSGQAGYQRRDKSV